jgi:hypothetical protein
MRSVESSPKGFFGHFSAYSRVSWPLHNHPETYPGSAERSASIHIQEIVITLTPSVSCPSSRSAKVNVHHMSLQAVSVHIRSHESFLPSGTSLSRHQWRSEEYRERYWVNYVDGRGRAHRDHICAIAIQSCRLTVHVAN